MFDTKYTLSLTKDYVSHWGVVEACRELIQNVIDNPKVFDYNFEEVSPGSFRFTLTSKDTTLSSSTLLLGSTSKIGENTIGHFGEGYKLALLVLTRNNKDVIILNGNRAWTPTFEYYKIYGAELLEIKERKLYGDAATNDLSFVVDNLTADEVAAIKDSWLNFQDDIGKLHQTSYGDILLDKPGMLYVGGLFVCKTEMKYGYNIKPRFVKLERDRQTISSWDLKWHSKEMWMETERFDEIAEMMRDDIPDVEYAEYGCPAMVKDACYRLFTSQNPGRLAARSQTELQSMIEQGLTKTVYVGATYGYAIQSSNLYRADLPKTVAKTSPEAYLRQWLRDNRKEMRSKSIEAFKGVIAAAKNWRQ